MSQASLQRSPTRTTTTSPPAANVPNNRSSMPPARRSTAGPAPNGDAEADTSTFVNQSASPPPQSASRVRSPDKKGHVSQTVPEDIEAEDAEEDATKDATSPKSASSRRLRNGTMDRNFRFPSPGPQSEPPVPPLPGGASPPPEKSPQDKHAFSPSTVVLEVPPPDPIEKERRHVDNEAEDEIGATEEISLN